MTKLEMEKAIISKIKAIVEDNNESDKIQREWIEREIESGSDPDNWKDQFFFNGYIYTGELEDIISVVMFDKPATVHAPYERGVRYAGIYWNNLTDDERAKINRVINGMVKANIIRVSKSGAMVKLLKED